MAGLTHAPWQGGYKWTLFRKFVDSSMPTTMASFSTQHCFHLGVWQCIVYTISWGLFSGTVVSSVVNALQRDHALVGRSLCAQQAFHVKKPAWNLPSVGCAMFERILNVILWSLPSGRSKHHDFASLRSRDSICSQSMTEHNEKDACSWASERLKSQVPTMKLRCHMGKSSLVKYWLSPVCGTTS